MLRNSLGCSFNDFVNVVKSGDDKTLSELTIPTTYLEMLYGAETVLCVAVERGHKEIVKLLLQAGANPVPENLEYHSPIHLAAFYGHEEILKMLIDKTHQIETCSEAGMFRKPLHIAAEHGRINVAKLLLKEGANVNIQDINRQTPLHFAIGSRQNKMVTMLLNEGANTEVKDNQGFTPLHTAANIGNIQATIELLKKGANPKTLNDKGDTPSQIAFRKNNLELAKLIQEFKLENIQVSQEVQDLKEIVHQQGEIIQNQQNKMLELESQLSMIVKRLNLDGPKEQQSSFSLKIF